MDGSAADDLKSLKILVKELSTKLADSRDEENKIDELIAAVAADAGINYEDFKRHQLAKSKEYFAKWDREVFNGGIKKASNNSNNNNNNNNNNDSGNSKFNSFNTYNRNNNGNGMVMLPSATSLTSASPSTSAGLSAPVAALSAEISKLSAMTDRTITAENGNNNNNNNNNNKSPSTSAIGMASIPPSSANSSNGLNSPTPTHEEDNDLDDLDKEIIKYQTENIKLEQQIQRNEFLITKYLPLLDREEEILKGLHDFLKEKDFAREKGEKILFQRFELQKSISDERINDLKQRHNATEKIFVQLHSMWSMIYHIVNKDLAKAESIKMEVEMVEDDVRLLLNNFNGYLNLADGNDREEEEEADIYGEKTSLEENVDKGSLEKNTNENELEFEETAKVNDNENGDENEGETDIEEKTAIIKAEDDNTKKEKLENKPPKDSQTVSNTSTTSISSDGNVYDDVDTQKTTSAETTPTKTTTISASELPSTSSPTSIKTVPTKTIQTTKSQKTSGNSNDNSKEQPHIVTRDEKTNDEDYDEDDDKNDDKKPPQTSNASASLVDPDPATPPRTPPMAIK